MEDDGVLLCCSVCGVVNVLCASCYRQRRYCDSCALQQRRNSCRSAKARYQKTPRGARLHAHRQSRYVARQRKKVTDRSLPQELGESMSPLSLPEKQTTGPKEGPSDERFEEISARHERLEPSRDACDARDVGDASLASRRKKASEVGASAKASAATVVVDNAERVQSKPAAARARCCEDCGRSLSGRLVSTSFWRLHSRRRERTWTTLRRIARMPRSRTEP